MDPKYPGGFKKAKVTRSGWLTPAPVDEDEKAQADLELQALREELAERDRERELKREETQRWVEETAAREARMLRHAEQQDRLTQLQARPNSVAELAKKEQN